MMQHDLFRTKIRVFDPLGIGAWAPATELDYMIPAIEGLVGLPEDDFVSRATAYFMGCFAEDELTRSEGDVGDFFRDLYRALAKQRANLNQIPIK